MRFRTVFGALAFAALAAAAAPSQAVPVIWSLDTTMSDSSTLIGSFTYDADTSTYSNIDLVWSDGYTFTHLGNPGYVGNQSFQSLPTTSTIGDGSATRNPYLYLDWVSPLTDAGGTIGIDHWYYDGTIDCGDAYCASVTGVAVIVSPDTTITAPEPVSAALLGTGIAGLIAARRRRT